MSDWYEGQEISFEDIKSLPIGTRILFEKNYAYTVQYIVKEITKKQFGKKTT